MGRKKFIVSKKEANFKLVSNKGFSQLLVGERSICGK
jgi:hypothetical protein